MKKVAAMLALLMMQTFLANCAILNMKTNQLQINQQLNTVEIDPEIVENPQGAIQQNTLIQQTNKELNEEQVMSTEISSNSLSNLVQNIQTEQTMVQQKNKDKELPQISNQQNVQEVQSKIISEEPKQALTSNQQVDGSELTAEILEYPKVLMFEPQKYFNPQDELIQNFSIPKQEVNSQNIFIQQNKQQVVGLYNTDIQKTLNKVKAFDYQGPAIIHIKPLSQNSDKMQVQVWVQDNKVPQMQSQQKSLQIKDQVQQEIKEKEQIAIENLAQQEATQQITQDRVQNKNQPQIVFKQQQIIQTQSQKVINQHVQMKQQAPIVQQPIVQLKESSSQNLQNQQQKQKIQEVKIEVPQKYETDVQSKIQEQPQLNYQKILVEAHSQKLEQPKLQENIQNSKNSEQIKQVIEKKNNPFVLNQQKTEQIYDQKLLVQVTQQPKSIDQNLQQNKQVIQQVKQIEQNLVQIKQSNLSSTQNENENLIDQQEATKQFIDQQLKQVQNQIKELDISKQKQTNSFRLPVIELKVEQQNLQGGQSKQQTIQDQLVQPKAPQLLNVQSPIEVNQKLQNSQDQIKQDKVQQQVLSVQNLENNQQIQQQQKNQNQIKLQQRIVQTQPIIQQIKQSQVTVNKLSKIEQVKVDNVNISDNNQKTQTVQQLNKSIEQIKQVQEIKSQQNEILMKPIEQSQQISQTPVVGVYKAQNIQKQVNKEQNQNLFQSTFVNPLQNVVEQQKTQLSTQPIIQQVKFTQSQPLIQQVKVIQPEIKVTQIDIPQSAKVIQSQIKVTQIINQPVKVIQPEIKLNQIVSQPVKVIQPQIKVTQTAIPQSTKKNIQPQIKLNQIASLQSTKVFQPEIKVNQIVIQPETKVNQTASLLPIVQLPQPEPLPLKFKFSPRLKSNQLVIEKRNKIKSLSQNTYKIFLMQDSLQSTCKGKCTNDFKIIKNSGWMALGVCNKNIIQANGFDHWETEQLGHGTYLLGSIGASWSSYQQRHNGRLKSFKYTTNDVVSVIYNPVESKIQFTKKGSIKNYTLLYDENVQDLYLCGILHYTDDQIEFIGGQYIEQPVVSTNQFLENSKINLEYKDIQNIKSYFNNTVKSLKMCYRASQNNYDAIKFHQKCDNLANTLTIIETTQGKNIGGFTPQSWSSPLDFQYVSDPSLKSFIFSLNINAKLDLSDSTYAISNKNDYGPTFGQVYGPADIFISLNPTKNNSGAMDSRCNVGYKYKNTQFNANTYENQTQFCGGVTFAVKDYQVYQVQFN